LFRYILFYKPYGCLSQFTGEKGDKTLSEFDLPEDVYAAGRLDKDSEGLLLLTDDGPFIKKLSDPKSHKEKSYWVQVEGGPTKEDLIKLSSGLLIQGKKTKKCFSQILNPQPQIEDRNPPIRYRKNIPTTWIEIKLTEGRNRQVRRMTAAIGFPTLRLIRVGIGKLSNELSPGSWVEVEKKDII
jgi:23S rRNA pseudouridine2457 synthase